jgi:hypothetical protein
MVVTILVLDNKPEIVYDNPLQVQLPPNTILKVNALSSYDFFNGF